MAKKPKVLIMGYKSPKTGKLMILSRRGLSASGISRYLPKSAKEIYVCSPRPLKGKERKIKLKAITREQLKRYHVLG